jgi:hypothetical protein
MPGPEQPVCTGGHWSLSSDRGRTVDGVPELGWEICDQVPPSDGVRTAGS